jgi:hypothetical protein
MSHHEDQLPSIDVDTLGSVTGGVASATSSQVATALQAIQSSLSNLGQSSNNGGNALTQMLPLMMLAQGGAGGGVRGCGCGMANCRR